MEYLNLETLTLIDIGARWGIDRRWNILGRRLNVIGFEPDIEECQKLNQKNDRQKTYYPFALSNKVGRESLKITSEPGRSSLYSPDFNLLKRYPDQKAFEILNVVEIPTNTLDNCLRENQVSYADFIKMDVQGSEKEILEGGIDTLKNLTFGLETEVEFLNLYEEQPLFSDVDTLCRKLGFTLFDIKPCYWKRTNQPIHGVGQLICADALYFKDYIHHHIIPSEREAAVSLILCLLYQKYDFALELLEYFKEQTIFSNTLYKEVKQILSSIAELKFPFNLKFRGRYRIANWLDYLSQKLKSAYWAQWDGWKS